MSKVVAVVSDMIFQSKIASTASAVGLSVVFVNSLESFREATGDASPKGVLVDLEQNEQVVAGILELSQTLTPKPTVIGYCPHVRKDVMDLAEQLGFDHVFPRSAFATNLEKILRSFDV
ncbi:MAG TPA: hypothetical protein PKN33_16785 [Phycisphaerae bacterium]|nr:hypothetical protein [Phycisphaerae bacterium]